MRVGSELSRSGCFGVVSNFGDYVVKVDQEEVDRDWSDRSLKEESEAQMEAAAYGIAPKCYGVVRVGNYDRGILMDKIYGCSIRKFRPNGFKITRRGQWLNAARSILKIHQAWEDGCPSHGDLHWDNLMITPSGRIYVIDWGREKSEGFESYYRGRLLDHMSTINAASTWNYDSLEELSDITDVMNQYENVKSGIIR